MRGSTDSGAEGMVTSAETVATRKRKKEQEDKSTGASRLLVLSDGIP
jgi:hypothetical protein